MKKIGIVVIMLFCLFGLANQNILSLQEDPAEAPLHPVVGQWVNPDNDILDFSADHQVFLNDDKFGSWKIMVDAGSTIIVNSSGSDHPKYFFLKTEGKNQTVLKDISEESQFEEKTFTRMNLGQDKQKKKK